MIVNMAGGRTPHTPSINAYFSAYTDSGPDEMKDLFDVAKYIFRCWISLRSSIASVVPNEDVDLFVQKVLQIIRVRIVYHLLVAHGVWVAQNESVHVEVAPLMLQQLRWLLTARGVRWRSVLDAVEIVLADAAGVSRFLITKKNHGLLRRCEKHRVYFDGIFLVLFHIDVHAADQFYV